VIVRVVSSYFVAAVIVEDNRVVEAAPILSWTIGKSRKWLNVYCVRKGWKMSVVGEVGSVEWGLGG
jgi:hypothetical protein